MSCTQEGFLKKVAAHKMTVLHEDGVYRHVRFQEPGTSCYHFDLITYPGFLVYSGDMGCFVFSRLHDMFDFFRNKDDTGNGLRINTGYWSEKLEAVSGTRNGADAMEFDADLFIHAVNEYRVRWMREGGLDKEQRRELWDEVEDLVINRISDGEQAAYLSANEFCACFNGDRFQFDDLFEHNFKRYTHQFIWCCYALVWGIQMYDTKKTEAA
jgi:hypothetical protein